MCEIVFGTNTKEEVERRNRETNQRQEQESKAGKKVVA